MDMNYLRMNKVHRPISIVKLIKSTVNKSMAKFIKSTVNKSMAQLLTGRSKTARPSMQELLARAEVVFTMDNSKYIVQ